MMRSSAAYISARKSLRLFSSLFRATRTTWQSRSCAAPSCPSGTISHRRLPGLEVPVGREDGLEAGHDRPLDTRDQFLPLQAAADVAGLVVRSGR